MRTYPELPEPKEKRRSDEESAPSKLRHRVADAWNGNSDLCGSLFGVVLRRYPFCGIAVLASFQELLMHIRKEALQ